MQSCEITDWHKCYGESWQGLIVSESFAHPAKFSRALIRCIYAHAVEEGWLVPGAVVVDPFGGVALGALHAMKHGLHWVGVELERPFHDMAHGCNCTGISKDDWVRWQNRWERARYTDGRHWCPRCVSQIRAIEGERNSKAIPFPPFVHECEQLEMFAPTPASASYRRDSGKIPSVEPHHYTGNIEDWEQLGLPGSATIIQGDSRELAQVVGEAMLCVSSPPYASNTVHGDKSAAHRMGVKSAPRNKWGQYATGQLQTDEYGSSPGQLAALPEGNLDACISSPPYTASLASDDPDKRGGLFRDPKRRGDKTLTAEYGESVGQLGAMVEGAFADGVVSSPPFESSLQASAGIDRAQRRIAAKELGKPQDQITPCDVATPSQTAYGIARGQLGQESGATFWSASRLIVEQVYQVLKPGGVAIWVTKSFVRKGERVDFPGQWRQLCEAVGFETMHEHRAHLVEERGAQYDLMGKLHEHKVERKSFFRRLAEKKGSPRIDWETIWCMRKPA